MKMKKYIKFIPLAFFSAVFLLTLTIPTYDYDLFFHLKSGEIISKLGIIHHDVFSYNTQGREWFPYEWLFQITVYNIEKIFGALGLKLFLSSLITLLILVFYKILRKAFNINQPISMFSSLFFLYSIYTFLTLRPHIPAYTLILTYILLILLYIVKNRNFLLLTIPLSLIWANFHGSIIINIYLFFSYAIISLLKKDLHKAKTLGLFTVFTAFLSVLPPIGLVQYRLLIYLIQTRGLTAKFIDEWHPLNELPRDNNSFYIP